MAGPAGSKVSSRRYAKKENGILMISGQKDKEVAVPSFRRRASVTDPDPVEESRRRPDERGGRADAGRRGRGRGCRGRGGRRRGARQGPGDPLASRGAGVRSQSQGRRGRTPPRRPPPKTADRRDGRCRDGHRRAVRHRRRPARTKPRSVAPRGRRWGLVLKVVAMTVARPRHRRTDRGQRATW